MLEKILCCEVGTLEQVSQGSCGCPTPERVMAGLDGPLSNLVLVEG